MEAFTRLIAIIRRLRAPDGCEWDRAQTPATLARHLQEEVAEVVDAVGDAPHVREELGDLLFVALSLVQLYEDAGAFTLDEVLAAISDKMVHRHPHIYAGAAERPEWSSLKPPRPPGSSAIDGIPRSLPTLARAQAITSAAARVGFDWPDLAGVRAKLDEEIAELEQALAHGEEEPIADELGDILFTVVNLSRFLPARPDPEAALRRSLARFEHRFQTMEAALLAEGRAVSTMNEADLDLAWRRAKEVPMGPPR